MKVVILAGGFGTRLAEETEIKPKPMVEIGGRPILWHIMKIYSSYGYNDFVICLGYKGYFIKEYFSNYLLHEADVTIDLQHNKTVIHRCRAEPWRITLVDTGLNTQTGGRIARIKDYVGDGDFMVTYGDGVADVNIRDLADFHKAHGKGATMTAVQPPGRFGAVEIGGDGVVRTFMEKPRGDHAWINGGFFVLSGAVFDYIAGDSIMFEREPLEGLSKDGLLCAYQHTGYWQAMDTLRDRNQLEELWQSGEAPWVVWDDDQMAG